MKILITGANGQLGLSIRNHPALPTDWQLIATDYPELDITSGSQVSDFLNRHHPDVVVNCAAYTAVDKAETERVQAMAINGKGPGILATACRDKGILLIHISTDYVFSGEGFRPYPENETPAPASFYGLTKHAGELEVAGKHPGSIILRTSWLYSEYGNNFVKTMLRLGNERDEIRVVADQTGSPTYAGDLARVILRLAERFASDPRLPSACEFYHVCNTGTASWFDLALASIEMAQLKCKVSPISTEEYPLPAPRPWFSVLDTKKTRKEIWPELPYWRDSLAKCLNNLKIK